jgi:hypothetical protein
MTFTPPAPPPPVGMTGMKALGYGLAGTTALSLLGGKKGGAGAMPDPGMIRPYEYTSTPNDPTGIYPSPFATASYDAAGMPIMDTRERNYFTQSFKALEPYSAKSGTPNPNIPITAARGGIMQAYQAGGPVERMSMMNTAMNPQGGMYPQGMIDKTQYATPTQRPVSAEMVDEAPAYERSSPMLMAEGGIARYKSKGQVNVLQDYIDRQEQQQMSHLPEGVSIPRTGIFRDTDVDTARKDALTAAMIRLGKAGKGAGIKPIALPKTAIKGLGDISGISEDTTEAAAGGTMRYNLGGYSDGGRMLKGPGDGMSDSIPASISGKQPARLADGEFVVPADVVSHLGNGSTDAGAKKLYGMMDKIRKARTGKKKQAPAVKASRYMPA